MKEFRKLVRWFNRCWFPEMEAHFDDIDSYPGWYRVYITDGLGMTSLYTFNTCREFREWAKGVVA